MPDAHGGGARWRVFVSHTSELREFPRGQSYVAEAELVVVACGHVIVDMADFPAVDLPSARTGARDQFAALLPVRERVQGPNHPDTLAARSNLAYWAEKPQTDRRGPMKVVRVGSRKVAVEHAGPESGYPNGRWFHPAPK